MVSEVLFGANIPKVEEGFWFKKEVDRKLLVLFSVILGLNDDEVDGGGGGDDKE